MTRLVDEIGHYTTIPESVIELWPEIGTDAVALFMYLRFRTNRERGVAFPTYARITKDTGWGRRRISGAIKALEEASLVKCHKRFGTSTEYALQSRQMTLGLDMSSEPESSRAAIQSRNATTGVALRDSTYIESSRESEPKQEPQRPNGRAPRPPAVELFRRIVHRYPNKTTWKRIDRTIGSDFPALLHWGRVLRQWVLAGHNPTNILDMLDVFKKGWRPASGNGRPGNARQGYDPAADMAAFKNKRGLR